MDRRKLAALTDLHRLSALKSDSELARLAAVAASRTRDHLGPTRYGAWAGHALLMTGC